MSKLDSLLDEVVFLTDKLKIEKAIKDPYFFLTEFCYTLDEHDSANPYKLIPKKEYVRDLCDVFQTESLIAVEKTRQMMATWIFCALVLWFTMFKEGCRSFVMSKKEKDANAIIDRIKLIYDRLPEIFRKEYTADPPTYLTLQWSKKNSIIQGIPQGPDQVRSYTTNLILMDEAAFQEKAEKVYEAAKPSLLGGGKFVAISTPNGREWFWRAVNDQF